MARTDHSISTIVLPSWMRAAAQCGINIEPIFAAQGIEVDLGQITAGLVPLPALDRVLGQCVATGSEYHFPFVVGEAFAFGYLPEVETYLSTSPTLRDAAQVLDWLPALVNPYVRTHLVETDDEARLEYSLEPAPRNETRPYYVEMFFAGLLKFIRSLAGEQAGLRLLRFSHSAPAYAARYESFFELPVCFDSARDELVFERGALDATLEGSSPALHQQAEAMVTEQVARRRSQPLSERIDSLFMREPALLAANLETIARRLALGPRTLQRHLADEKTRFATVREAAMCRQAQRWISDDKPLEHIAERLGFTDRRSFTRAFKRWAGDTPSAYRKKTGGSD